MQQPSPSPTEDSSPEGPGHDPSEWVDLHGDILYRFAILRVKDEHVAEDLVQETFLSALRASDRYKGDSAFGTWLIGILRHKIIDHFRRNTVEIRAADITLWEDEDDREFFDDTGHWKRSLQDWKDSPDKLVENREFWNIFQSCLSDLPETHRRAFTLGEIDGMKGEEVCEILSVTPANFWVMLHRARAKLRKCLDANWFQTTPKRGG
jgi:RNA polymerase sigma-70 factor (TIGR02943 family)